MIFPKTPLIVVEQQAREAAAAGLPLRDACPYPFGTGEGMHYAAVYLLSLPRDSNEKAP